MSDLENKIIRGTMALGMQAQFRAKHPILTIIPGAEALAMKLLKLDGPFSTPSPKSLSYMRYRKSSSPTPEL